MSGRKESDSLKIRREELENKIRSKDDLYYILSQCCKLLLLMQLSRTILFTNKATMFH